MRRRSHPLLYAAAALAALAALATAACWDFARADIECGDNACDAPYETAAGCPADCGWQQLSAGELITCGVRRDGSVWCWGAPQGLGSRGKITSPSAVPVRVKHGASFIQVAVGHLSVCALTVVGEIWCWGANEVGQLGGNTWEDSDQPVRNALCGAEGALPFKAVTMGDDHGCAIRDDKSLWCWGLNADGQLGNHDNNTVNLGVRVVRASEEGYLSNVRAVSAGHAHTCAIHGDDNYVSCWGSNRWGQLGDGTGFSTNVPKDVQVGCGTSAQLSDAISLSSGAAHSCAVTNEGNAYCWGANWAGQLGNDIFDSTPCAVAVDNLADASQIASSSHPGRHTCAVTMDNALYCWGQGYHGQLSVNDTENVSSPVAVAIEDVTLLGVTAGAEHTCAWSETGLAWCWGRNFRGVLGSGTREATPLPVQVLAPGSLQDVDLKGGYRRLCLDTYDGSPQCTGLNDAGQLGVGGSEERSTFTDLRVPGITGLSQRGWSHSCGIDYNNILSVHCWGANYLSQLGILDATDFTIEIDFTSPVLQVTTGGDHACARISGTSLAAVHCWGDNRFGQAGADPTAYPVVVSPEQVAGAFDCLYLSAGAYHTCAVTTEAVVQCWGLNRHGQLGVDPEAEPFTHIPTEVSLPNAVAEVRAGRRHTCARGMDGAIWCWGANAQSQLGQPDVTAPFVPTQVAFSGAPTFSSLCVGLDHACVLTAGGEVWCWGANVDGALGVGDFKPRPAPVPVGLDGVADQITCGSNFSCARLENGSLWCWGDGSYGQLDNGRSARTPEPQILD